MSSGVYAWAGETTEDIIETEVSTSTFNIRKDLTKQKAGNICLASNSMDITPDSFWYFLELSTKTIK